MELMPLFEFLFSCASVLSHLSWILFNSLRVLHTYELQACVENLLSIHVLMSAVFTILVECSYFCSVCGNDLIERPIFLYLMTCILLHSIALLVKYGVPGLPG